MKKSLNTITIENPCHENWEAMSATEKGKHCHLCKKNVIDFSTMNDTEIIEIIQTYKNESLCGRFNSSQLDRPLYKHRMTPYTMPKFNRLFASLMILATVSSSIASTPDDKSIKTDTTMIKGDVKISSATNTENKNPIVLSFKGKVLDEDTKLPIYDAYISIGNTQISSFTNEDGVFNIVIPDSIKSEIYVFNINNIGHESVTLTVKKNDLSKDYMIQLKKMEKKFMGQMIMGISKIR